MKGTTRWNNPVALLLAVIVACGLVPVGAYAADGAPKPKVKQLVSGIYHTLAVMEDGRVMAWGDNGAGQIGDGTSGNTRATPVYVQGLKNVIAVAGGKGHSMALTKDGQVWTWGSNNDGELGDGTITTLASDYVTIIDNHNRSTPKPVPGLSGVTAIAAGWGTSYALKADGTVWAWGSNAMGELGIGDRVVSDQPTPVRVVGLSDVVSISAGWNNAHAIKRDGSAWSWGYNDSGNAGDGTKTQYEIEEGNVWVPVDDQQKDVPVEVAGGHRFQSIATMDNNSVYALDTSGALWFWGVYYTEKTAHYELTPVRIATISSIAGVYAVSDGVLVLKKDGSLWTTDKKHDDFIQINLPKIKSVSAGGWYHALAIAEDGSVWAWGANSYGQLGNGTTKRVPESKPVMLEAFYAPAPATSKPAEQPKPVTPSASVNGKAVTAKVNVVQGVPMLSGADAAKLLGGKLTQNAKTKVYTLTRGKSKLEFSVGSTSAKLNGKTHKLKQKPVNASGSLWVPAAVLEALGAKTKWDAKTKRFDIQVK